MTEAMYEDLLKRKQLQIDEYWQLINEQDKHIVELQEENARLQKEIEKAKELLRDWLQIAHKNHAPRCYGFVKDTEQFLNIGGDYANNRRADF